MAIEIIQTDPNIDPPCYATKNSAGFDISVIQDLTIPPNGYIKARTGLKLVSTPEPMELEDGSVVTGLFILPRSSLIKRGLILANSVGLVDMDYREEILLLLLNVTSEDVMLRRGDKVAQGVFQLTYRPDSINVSNVVRIGGFGSTGG